MFIFKPYKNKIDFLKFTNFIFNFLIQSPWWFSSLWICSMTQRQQRVDAQQSWQTLPSILKPVRTFDLKAIRPTGANIGAMRNIIFLRFAYLKKKKSLLHKHSPDLSNNLQAKHGQQNVAQQPFLRMNFIKLN